MTIATATSIAALLTALVTLATAVFGAIKAVRAGRTAARAEAIGKANGTAIQEIHISINSRMDELLRITASASRAEGAKEEKDRNP